MHLKHSTGFTLLEVMITVLIVGILAGIATVSYSNYVLQSARTDAKGGLMDISGNLEKCKALYGSYNAANCSIANGANINSPDGFYQVAVTTAATTFTLVATPPGGSPQQNDDECTSFTLNHLGQQTATGTDALNCW